MLAPSDSATRVADDGARGGEPAQHHRLDIQGLRALAVALVVLYHADVPGISGGFIGVDVFFVISGFVITNLLQRELSATGKVSVLRFYGRRAQRIIPLAVLVIVVTVALSYRELGFLRGKVIAGDGRWAALFAANIHFASTGTDYLGSQLAPSPLQHYWSLAVEEQFYVVWPLVLWGLYRLAGRASGPRTLLVGAAAIMMASYAWSIVQTSTNGIWAYFSTLTRAGELMAGAVVAVAAPTLARLSPRLREMLAVTGLAVVLIAAFALDRTTPFPGSAVALPMVGTALLLASGCGGVTPLIGRQLLSLPPVVLIGDISFSLYLWHWPLLTIAAEQQTTPLAAADRVALVAGSVILSFATYLAVENPLRLSRVLKRRPTVSVSMAVVLIAASFVVVRGLVGYYTPSLAPATATGRPSTSTSGAAALPSAAAVERLVGQAATIKTLSSNLTPSLESPGDDGAPQCPQPVVSLGPGNYCVYGDPSATKTMAVLGDSHAGEWTYALAPLAKRYGYRLYRFALPACPAPDLRFIAPQTNAPNTDCDTYHRLAQAKIKSLNPDILVVTESTKQLYDTSRTLIDGARWADGLAQTLRSAKGSSTKEFVLGDYAYLPINAADCLAAHLDDVQACSVSRASQAAGTVRSSERSGAAAAGATYIDTLPWVCSSTCTAVIGDYLVYKDIYHLSAAYSQFLEGAVAAKLGLQ